MYLLGLIAQQIVSGEKSKSLPERIYSEFGLLDKCIFQKHQMTKKKALDLRFSWDQDKQTPLVYAFIGVTYAETLLQINQHRDINFSVDICHQLWQFLLV